MHFRLHFRAYIIPRCCALSSMCTHIPHATPTHILLHFYTYIMLCCCTFSCTSGHTGHATLLHILLHFQTTSCHAAARSLAFRHIRDATLLHYRFHFHTYVMLRARIARYPCEAWKGSSKQQVPESASNGKTLSTAAMS